MEKIHIIIILGFAIIILGFLIVFTLPNSGLGAIELEKCNSLVYNGDDKINIVFFSDKNTVENYINAFYNTKPFSENKEKFNFYFIDDYKPKCDIFKGIALLCYSKELVEKAGSCPNDYIVVVKDAEENIRSSSYMNIMSINKLDTENVFLHEFGHTFADFAEEYTPSTIPKKAVNCFKDCEEFKGKEDGCFQGCSNEDYYRSIDNGIMRTLISNNFGNFNEFVLRNRIEESIGKPLTGVTGKAIKSNKDCSKEKYFLIKSIFDGNKIKFLDKKVNEGCAGKGYGEYRYEIKDRATVRETGSFNPQKIFTDVQVGEKIEGNIFINEGEFYLVLPFVEDAKELVIKDLDGKIVSSLSLEDINSRACKI